MNAIPAQSYFMLQNNIIDSELPGARITEDSIIRATQDGEVRITE